MRLVLAAALMLSALVRAQSDSIAPDASNMSTQTATNFAKGIGAGWNVGNSLEAVLQTNGVYVPSETGWGNPMISQRLIDSVKAAGFNAIRLPVAWSKFTDSTTFTIDPAWLTRVETVVNYALGRNMYVLMNEHWDGGWLQPTAKDSAYADRRLKAIWKQVAKRFRDYGDHLLFAGTNEVMVPDVYSDPTAENQSAQNRFNQIFVNTVRSTGGRNAYRYLVVQGYNTNINQCVAYLKIPTDPAKNRLMVEIHFYDPYEFTISENHAAITQWGATATDAAKKATWGDEAYVDGQFAKMKTTFADKGYPVVVGEYGTILKNTTDNPAYRLAWTRYVTAAATKTGALPFYWDNGGTDIKGMGLFDRNTGARAFPDLIRGIVAAAPVPVGVLPAHPRADALVRSGDRLASSRPIALFDLSGAPVRTSRMVADRHELPLGGLSAGLYVARSGERSETILAR